MYEYMSLMFNAWYSYQMVVHAHRAKCEYSKSCTVQIYFVRIIPQPLFLTCTTKFYEHRYNHLQQSVSLV